MTTPITTDPVAVSPSDAYTLLEIATQITKGANPAPLLLLSLSLMYYHMVSYVYEVPKDAVGEEERRFILGSEAEKISGVIMADMLAALRPHKTSQGEPSVPTPAKAN